MKDYFNRLARDDPEYRRLKEAMEPGYQFARAIGELQTRMGVSFEEFCRIVGIPEEELEEILMEFRIPTGDVLQKIQEKSP